MGAVLGVFALAVPVALADISIQSPATFTLNRGEKVTITNRQNMQIELVKIESISVQTYPVQAKKMVQIEVTRSGGCGANVDPHLGCFGAPEFGNTFVVNEGGSVSVLSLVIKAKSIASDSATFTVSDDEGEGTPPVSGGTTIVSPGGNEVVVPIGNPGGTTGGNAGGSGSGVSEPGVITVDGGVRTICFYGSTNGACNEKGTPVPVDVTGTTQPLPNSLPINLSARETVTSVTKVESEGSTAVSYDVKVEKDARILFLFSVKPEIVYSINPATGRSTVKSRPWWNFLAW